MKRTHSAPYVRSQSLNLKPCSLESNAACGKSGELLRITRALALGVLTGRML